MAQLCIPGRASWPFSILLRLNPLLLGIVCLVLFSTGITESFFQLDLCFDPSKLFFQNQLLIQSMGAAIEYCLSYLEAGEEMVVKRSTLAR